MNLPRFDNRYLEAYQRLMLKNSLEIEKPKVQDKPEKKESKKLDIVDGQNRPSTQNLYF